MNVCGTSEKNFTQGVKYTRSNMTSAHLVHVCTAYMSTAGKDHRPRHRNTHTHTFKVDLWESKAQLKTKH